MRLGLPTLWRWAARDVLRRPAEALLALLALASLVTVLGAGLLLGQGLAETAEVVLADSPPLVVRRVGPGGWSPMPAKAVARAKAVRGVTGARARYWGLVRWGAQTLTVIGATPQSPLVQQSPPAKRGLVPAEGKAVIGSGVGLEPGDYLTVRAAETQTFEVVRKLPRWAGLVAHDVVIVSPAEARALLGLAPGMASDLAVEVYNEQSESDAIRPDLSKAFDFPVKISTRRESLGAARARIERAAGLRTLVLVPALLALALLTLAAVRIQLGARAEIGLLKALGWTSGDVVRLSLARALVIGLPALALGWALAYGLVFGPWGASWAGTLLFGWSGQPPVLTLAPTGALLTLLEVGGLVIAPWLAAAALPALRSATADPEQWLRGEGA